MLIRAEREKINENSKKVNIKTRNDSSCKYLMRIGKTTYKILSLCEEF